MGSAMSHGVAEEGPGRPAVRRTWRPGFRRILLSLIILGAIGAGLVLLGRGSGNAATTTVSGRLAIGSPAPDFTTPTLGGKTVRLRQFRGQVVLINFWATWCTACREEMPAIRRAWEQYRSKGFTVLEVNYRETDGSAMRRFLKEVGVPFDTALDPDGKIAAAYGASIGLPVSVFVDRDGKARTIQLGQMAPALINQRIQALI